MMEAKSIRMIVFSVVVLLILYLLFDINISNASQENDLLWGKFQLSYVAQIESHSDTIPEINEPLYSVYKWIVRKNN